MGAQPYCEADVRCPILSPEFARRIEMQASLRVPTGSMAAAMQGAALASKSKHCGLQASKNNSVDLKSHVLRLVKGELGTGQP